MDFSRRMKGALTQTLVRSLLADAGYRVVPLGIEEVIREVASLEAGRYLQLGLPTQLRSLPDFLVTADDFSRAWMLEVKYRVRWNDVTREALRPILAPQVEAWGEIYFMVFLGEHAGNMDTPANRCGIFPLRWHNGALQYKSRYRDEWFDWERAEWQFATKPSAIFERLGERAEEQTIMRCCDFAATYPGIFDN